MSRRTEQYLNAIGIQQWRLRDAPNIVASRENYPKKEGDNSLVVDTKVSSPADTLTQPVSALDWTELQQRVAPCTQCSLHSSRKQTVFGVGNRQTDFLVIGEAPGADEDAQGEPFVGRAGKLLNAMLLAIGFQREEVYIANILKCRPPNNRDPQPEEISQCKPYLHRQIQLIEPKVILAVGRIAAQSLLQSEQAIGRLRGTVHKIPEYGIPIVVTYHPAYLLRRPIEKRKSWQDLQLARRVLREGY